MKNKAPDLNYLKYFYYVAKLGGFTKAAAQLKVQQPVVSRAVKLLEQDLSCKLLERQKKNVILTVEGRKVFEQCESIFNSVEKIPDLVQAFDEGESFLFSFVSSDSLSFGILEKVLRELRKDFPNVIFQHQSGSITSFIEDIRNGNIEMGFFFNIPKLPNGLVKSKLAPVSFHFVMKKSKLHQEEIALNFIATIAATQRPEDVPLLKEYRAYKKQAHVSIISNSSITRKSMVLSGLGVSSLPEFMVDAELKSGQLERVGRPEEFTLFVVERQASYRTRLKTRLIELVKEVV